MTETPKVGLKFKVFCKNLILSPFLSKSLHPGVQEKKEKAWGQIRPTPGVIRSKMPGYIERNTFLAIRRELSLV